MTANHRFRELREYSGLSQKEFGERLGFEAHKVRDLESGKQKVSLEIARKIEDKFSVHSEWVMSGEGDRFTEKGPPGVKENHSDIYGGFKKVGVYAMAGAGPPNSVILEEPIDEIIIPTAWNKPSILPIKVRGKSMEETISEGAYVGVDREDKFIVSGKIYAVWLPHEGAVIKRIYLDMEKITLKSDNPVFPDIFVPLAGISEHFIQGRVAWVIQKL